MTELPVDVGVTCLSSIDWDFLWQGHQQIMSDLARSGHRVLFVENSGVRPPGPRDAPRLVTRLQHWWRGDRGLREVAPVSRCFRLSSFLFRIPR
jgi:hypothetical protein